MMAARHSSSGIAARLFMAMQELDEVFILILLVTNEKNLCHLGLHTCTVFERALHAAFFTLMTAKTINAHQCFARRVRSTLWNSH